MSGVAFQGERLLRLRPHPAQVSSRIANMLRGGILYVKIKKGMDSIASGDEDGIPQRATQARDTVYCPFPHGYDLGQWSAEGLLYHSVPWWRGRTPQLHTSALRRSNAQECPCKEPQRLGTHSRVVAIGTLHEAAGRSDVGRADASSCGAHCVLTTLLHALQKLCCTPQR